MKIETKYNLEDTVWAMRNNKCYYFRIKKMLIKVENCPTSDIGKIYNTNIFIIYKDDNDDIFYENDLFASKEDLIKSL